MYEWYNKGMYLCVLAEGRRSRQTLGGGAPDGFPALREDPERGYPDAGSVPRGDDREELQHLLVRRTAELRGLRSVPGPHGLRQSHGLAAGHEAHAEGGRWEARSLQHEGQLHCISTLIYFLLCKMLRL